LIVLAISRLALAQPTGLTAQGDSPWSAGVTAEDQAVAFELYSKGNVEFEDARFEKALELYLEAIKHWDHPAIRYNMAVAYNNLGQLLEAEDNLERALRFGEPPLGHTIYLHGLEYQHNFESRLARVKISCKEPDTQVSLDGRLLFTGPGAIEKLVLPGEHQIVGAKPGFLTVTENLDLAAGSMKTYDVRLVAMKPQTHMVRRWETWKPWAVAGAGAGVVGLGALAYLAARHDMDQYDRGIAARCPHGCDGATLASLGDLRDDQSRSHVERDIGISLFVLGGATIAAGLVGVVLDQPRAVTERIVVTPTRGGGGVALRWSY
jgi:hypothetical protein